MADTYSKLLGLSSTPPPPPDAGKAKAVKTPQPKGENSPLLVNQQTRKLVNKKVLQKAPAQTSHAPRPPVSPLVPPEQALDTSLLTTKEKTRYGTYLTDESIEKISIRAIQLKRDAHQIV